MRRPYCLLAKATIADESMPPLRNTPTGTSLIKWLCTACARRSRTVSAAVVKSSATDSPAGSDANWLRRASPWDTVSNCPGSTLSMPAKSVFAPSAASKCRYSPSPAQCNSASTAPEASTALISEPKTKAEDARAT